MLQVLPTALRDVKLIQFSRFRDDRGWFSEVFNRDAFARAGLPGDFVQDNQSFSSRGVLRGLHYQLGRPQGKLIRCLRGCIWDVAVDLRRDSPDFGRHVGLQLQPPSDHDELQMLWIPEGFAHGFLVLSDSVEVLYKTTDFYHPAGERTIRWNDPDLGIPWPLGQEVPILSSKDARAVSFREAELL